MIADKVVRATDIKLALAKAHEKDYFLTECKNGSTHFPSSQGLLIFDGIAIKRSYTSPCISIFEVKVSRNDFLQDNKWHLYLQYCNEFYFVVPKGMVRKDELPDNVGLIWYDPEKGKVRTVKKALYREIEEPTDVYKYIIYSRLTPDRIPFYESKAEYAKDYLEDKERKQSIGYALGSKMAKQLQQYEEDLSKIEMYKRGYRLCERLKDVIQRHNVLSRWKWKATDDEWVEALDKVLSGSLSSGTKDVIRQLRSIADTLEKSGGGVDSDC